MPALRDPPTAPAAGPTRTPPQLHNLNPAQQLRAGKLPRRFLQLIVGSVLFGASIGFVIQSQLGAFPWDVLHQGLARHLPITVGMGNIITGVSILLLWIPLRQALGLGTILNAVAIGVFTDLTILLVPVAETLPLQGAFMAGGILLNGIATATYIGSQFGPGPRDGLMTGLARVTGRSIRLVRTGLEAAVVAVGFLLGGTLGVGTLLYALAIGPLTQFFLRFLTVELDLE